MSVSRFSQSSLQNGFEKFNTIWDGKTAVGSMEFISALHILDPSGVSSVNIFNIPQTYKNLHVRISAVNTFDLRMRPNGEVQTYYSANWLRGNGTSTSSLIASAQTAVRLGSFTSGSDPSSILIDIFDYATTTGAPGELGGGVRKTIKFFSGNDQNGSNGTVSLGSSSYADNANVGISRLNFFASSGNVGQHTKIAVYGVK